GQYVRLRDAAESALLDRRLSVPREAADWLDKDIVDIADGEVVEFEIEHPDGERVLARKVSVGDENFTLEDLPEGREIKSAWTVDSLAGSLSALTLDAVATDDSVDWSEAAAFRLLTVDGLQIRAELAAVMGEEAESTTDDTFWIRLQAGTYTTAVERIAEQEAEAADPAERAAEINDRVAGWAYRIPKYKFDSMTKRMDDLLKEVESS
ncbi:MAG: DUF4340 domain-containing protein, partial [Gammaproteobacteria bacterium]|nr:DUF4340 domain-containing protein [Gammaproteobacteria bacterium]